MADFMAAVTDIMSKRQRSQAQSIHTSVLSSTNANENNFEAGSRNAWSAEQTNFSTSRQFADAPNDDRLNRPNLSSQKNANSYSDGKMKNEKSYEITNTTDWQSINYSSTQRDDLDQHTSLTKRYYSEEGILLLLLLKG